LLVIINLPGDLNVRCTPLARFLWSCHWCTIAVEVLMLMLMLVKVLVMMLMILIMHEL